MYVDLEFSPDIMTHTFIDISRKLHIFLFLDFFYIHFIHTQTVRLAYICISISEIFILYKGTIIMILHMYVIFHMFTKTRTICIVYK